MRDRKVEVFCNGGWADIPFANLKIGNKVRMFEPDGSPVIWDRTTDWVVTKEPKRTKTGVLGIECDKTN